MKQDNTGECSQHLAIHSHQEALFIQELVPWLSWHNIPFAQTVTVHFDCAIIKVKQENMPKQRFSSLADSSNSPGRTASYTSQHTEYLPGHKVIVILSTLSLSTCMSPSYYYFHSVLCGGEEIADQITNHAILSLITDYYSLYLLFISRHMNKVLLYEYSCKLNMLYVYILYVYFSTCLTH